MILAVVSRGLVHHLDGVYLGVVFDGNEAEYQQTLGVGHESVKGLVQGAVGAARFLKDIEVAKKR